MGRQGLPPYKSSTNAGGNEEIMAASIQAESVDSPRLDAATLNVVRMTPPVEATLRILLNSVPYLIGAAVVRQPAVGDAVEAEVGRMPWLHDRRLLTLQLPDDSLPANRAILLDWPVPYQAEWVGAPPRLLISRLVTQDRTVGVLLGTMISRDQISAGAREALDLSCELIAAAAGSDSLGTRNAAPTVEEPRLLVVVPNEPRPVPGSPLVIPPTATTAAGTASFARSACGVPKGSRRGRSPSFNTRSSRPTKSSESRHSRCSATPGSPITRHVWCFG